MDYSLIRPKDLLALTAPVDADEFTTDSDTNGTRAVTFADLKTAIASAFVAAPATFNLAPVVAGKIPDIYLPITGGLVFVNSVAGNAVPATAPAVGNFYVISSAGTSQTITWAVGDWAIYKGTSGQWAKVSAATVALAAGGTGATTAAGARTNLGVLSNEESWSLGHARARAGGLFSPVGSTYAAQTLSGGGVKLGLLDFSLSLVAQCKWNSGGSFTFFKTNTGGNSQVAAGYIPTSKQIFLNWTNAAGGNAGQNLLTLDGANLIDGETYLFVITFDRDGNATAYVNSVNDRDGNAVVVNSSIATKSTIDLGAANAIEGGICSGLDGIIYSCRVFNRLLSLADIQVLNRTGSLSYSDQYGSLTKYASDFSVGADGFTVSGSGAVTGNQDAIALIDDTLLVDTVAATSVAAVRTIPIARKTGQRVKLTYDIYIPVANVLGVTITARDQAVQNIGFTAQTPTKGVWTTYTEEIILTAPFTGIRFALFTAGGITNIITAGDKFYLKNVVIEYPGCIGDWDFDGANPALSTTLRDNAGNYDCALLSLAVQTQSVKQFNPETLTVGGGSLLKKILSQTAVIDFASIAAQSTNTTTATVTGAAVGDTVNVNPGATPPAGVIFSAYVSAANTVTVRAQNITGGAIDPASDTYRLTVFQF